MMEAPDVPETPQHRVRLRTRWSDEDTQAVLNNAVYATLLEEARHVTCERLGLLQDNRFPFVLLQSNLRFLAPGRGGREVEVELSTTYVGQSSFRQAYRVRDLASGTVLCEAEALLVAWDAERRASRPLDAALRQKLGAPGRAAGDQ